MEKIKTFKILCIKTYFILPLLALFIVTASCSDDDNDNHDTTNKDKELIDTRGLDLYIQNAEKLQAGSEPSEAEWNALFETPAYQIFLGFYTREQIKDNMRVPYQQQNLTPDQQELYAHHLEYKANLNQLKAYSAQLKDGTIRDKTSELLYPFLPTRLQNKDLIPVMVYSYYSKREANGLPDKMIMDGLLAYETDSWNPGRGLLGAHEAFHSVSANAFDKRKKITLPETDTRQIVLNSLRSISGEGIADLIDKDVLGQPSSPVYELFLTYQVNEQQNSINFINTLNTRLEGLSNGGTITDAEAYKNSVLSQVGHQPGRYMGRAIRQVGLLNVLKIEPENPFAFFYIYNTAATILGNSNYPVFSQTAINYLRQLENQLINPL
ncbi:MAG TPA: DUF5700 domain-containing putative Zn-dependent protease [Flavobacterium sp.]|jgi:hypothetical protein